MKHAQRKINPAWTAIAAVLAFGSTPALAQDAGTTASPGPTTQAPANTAPVTPPVINLPPVAPAPTAQPAPAPTVQPIPETVQPLPEPEPQTATETNEAAPAPARTARTAPSRAAPAPAAPPASTATQAEPTAPDGIAETENAASGELDALIEDAPAVAAEPATAAPEATAENAESTPWGLIAGLAALLIGGIAAAMMAFRRRKTPGDHPAFTEATPVTDRVDTATEERAEMIETAEPVHTPAAQPRKIQPVAAIPATATGTRGNSSKLEEMVAEEPSPENPFLTYRKRLNRAKFILRQREASMAKFDKSADDAGYVTSKPLSRDARIVTRETEDA